MKYIWIVDYSRQVKARLASLARLSWHFLNSFRFYEHFFPYQSFNSFTYACMRMFRSWRRRDDVDDIFFGRDLLCCERANSVLIRQSLPTYITLFFTFPMVTRARVNSFFAIAFLRSFRPFDTYIPSTNIFLPAFFAHFTWGFRLADAKFVCQFTVGVWRCLMMGVVEQLCTSICTRGILELMATVHPFRWKAISQSWAKVLIRFCLDFSDIRSHFIHQTPKYL